MAEMTIESLTKQINELKLQLNEATQELKKYKSQISSNNNVKNADNTHKKTSSSSGFVAMKYSAIEDICQKIQKIITDLNDEWDDIKTVVNSKEQTWRGSAAKRFYDELEKEVNSISELTSKGHMPSYISSLINLVESNKNIDKKLIGVEFTKVDNNLPYINANGVITNAHTTNDELNSSVKVNDNINANGVITNAHTTNDELNNSVKVNDNINANGVITNAHTTNDELNESVKINDNIKENNFTANAHTTNDELINEVGIDVRMGESKTDNTIKNNSNNIINIDDIIKGMTKQQI